MAKQRTAVPASEDQLLKQLKAAPLVDVLGVLAESGVGAGKSRGDEQWTLVFAFASWRLADGPLRTDEIVVRRKVREKEIDEYQKIIQPQAVMRIRARVVEKSVWDRPEALLVRVVGREKSDAELNAEVRRLQQPVRFKDQQFGTFTLDRTINWYQGRASWNGKKVRLSLSANTPADLKKCLQAARRLWQRQKSWGNKVTAYAVKQLLPLKNGNWLGDNEKPLTVRQFKARMKLQSITVGPDASFEFWHNDGDLFWGHSILISGSLKKGLYDADIPG